MDNTVYEFDAPSQADAEFLAGIRARRMVLQKELASERPIEAWKVAIAAVFSGTVLAAVVITTAYLALPMAR